MSEKMSASEWEKTSKPGEIIVVYLVKSRRWSRKETVICWTRKIAEEVARGDESRMQSVEATKLANGKIGILDPRLSHIRSSAIIEKAPSQIRQEALEKLTPAERAILKLKG